MTGISSDEKEDIVKEKRMFRFQKPVLMSILLILVAACAHIPAAWAQLTPVRIAVLPISDFMAAWIADERGFFKEEGLSVTITPMRAGSAIQSAIEGGSIDIGATAIVPVSQATAAGFTYVIVAPATIWNEKRYVGKRGPYAIMVKKGSSIKTAKDLVGKKVSVVSLQSLADLVFTTWAEKNGADSTKIQKVEVPFPQHEAALNLNQVDAVVQVEPFVTSALDHNVADILAPNPWSAIAPRFQQTAWVVKKEWGEPNKKTVVAFNNAIKKAAKYIESNDKDARKILAKATKLSEDLAGRIVLPEYNESVRKEDLQIVIDVMTKYKFLSKSFDASVLISPYIK